VGESRLPGAAGRLPPPPSAAAARVDALSRVP
jgi:hypothetical protein